ncbi:hypothetical protein [Planococcus chinensis]|uniref:Uncharacterized protein n=1 Tax=Planococcus chinensis TaxID=272917 RepID=A0ABW4QHJ0_9BACL
MGVERRVIEVNIFKITTPKVRYFIFWKSANERLNLTFEPFKIKKPTKEYPYEYHMYGDDILLWKEYSSSIFSYYDSYIPTSWENAMKYEMYTAILSGKLNRTGKYKQTGEKIEIKFNWVGDPVPKAKIEYK